MNIFEERRKKLMEAMQACGVDAALFAPSSDFLYLTGSSRKPAQRVTALIIGPERSAVFMPDLKSPATAGWTLLWSAFHIPIRMIRPDCLPAFSPLRDVSPPEPL